MRCVYNADLVVVIGPYYSLRYKGVLRCKRASQVPSREQLFLTIAVERIRTEA